jgi:branched-chain amino acid transport system ATP-binding protein
MNPAWALQLQKVHKSFGSTPVVTGVSLALAAGEHVALIGPNGSGKSTLFNLISGQCAPTAGAIFLNGQPIHGRPPFEINRLGLARSFQKTHVFERLSVWDNLRCGLMWSMGHGYAFWRLLARHRVTCEKTEQLMHALALHPQRDTLAMNLTHAQQRALELGVTLASGASVVLLDEPTAGMSHTDTQTFVALIQQLTVGKTLLIVEHDMQVVFGLAQKIAVLVRGELVAFDRPAIVRANPQVQEAYLGLNVDG